MRQMKWVTDKTGRFPQRPHFLPGVLDMECEQLIGAFLQKKYGRIEYPVKTNDLTIFLEEEADLDSCADLSMEGDNVQGLTEFDPGSRPLVKISNALNEPYLENRLRTTITYEYGHVHYHRFLFELETSGGLFGDHRQRRNSCKWDDIENSKESDWMEWQAGYVCGAILMPATALSEKVKAFRTEQGLSSGYISLDSATGRSLVDLISGSFKTSKEASRVRLMKLGLLNDDGSKKGAALF